MHTSFSLNSSFLLVPHCNDWLPPLLWLKGSCFDQQCCDSPHQTEQNSSERQGHGAGGWRGGGGTGADLHPGLLMQVCDVELPARCMRHQFVMFLQNLVETLQGLNTNTTVTNQHGHWTHGTVLVDMYHMVGMHIRQLL